MRSSLINKPKSNKEKKNGRSNVSRNLPRRAPHTRDFHNALRRENNGVKLLAEIKAASPSKGTIREDFDPAQIAALYETLRRRGDLCADR